GLAELRSRARHAGRDAPVRRRRAVERRRVGLSHDRAAANPRTAPRRLRPGRADRDRRDRPSGRAAGPRAQGVPARRARDRPRDLYDRVSLSRGHHERHQDAPARGSTPAEDRAVSPAVRAPRLSALVTTEWLARNLGRRDLRVVDGSWHMPQLKRDARAEYAQAHIPRPVFFDIDAIADPKTPLPHMLPSAADVPRNLGPLGN